MSLSQNEAELAAASGRTVEEHRDIVAALRSDPAGSAQVVLDFEGGSFDGWSKRRLAKPWSAAIQSDIVRVGSRAARFEIRSGDYVSGGQRAELRDWYNAEFERDIWYGFATLLPEGFDPPPGVGVVLAQWHDQAEIGQPAGKPPLAIRYRDGALRFTGAFAETASDEPERAYLFHELAAVERRRWLDFVFRIRWSRFGDSQVEAWLGGTPLFAFDGPLGYRNEVKGPYFKLGVYTNAPIDGPLVVYHDNYARGPGFEAVNPAVLHGAISGGEA